MSVSKAQQKAVNKYIKEKLDRINLTVPKGEKERIQEDAAFAGQSTNQYIYSAILAYRTAMHRTNN